MLLLICSTSWSQNDSIPITQDSALVSIESLKKANAKMLELKYEKEINCTLTEIIETDSIIINSLEQDLYNCAVTCEEEVAKVEKERNTAIAVGSGTSLILLILLIIVL